MSVPKIAVLSLGKRTNLTGSLTHPRLASRDIILNGKVIGTVYLNTHSPNAEVSLYPENVKKFAKKTRIGFFEVTLQNTEYDEKAKERKRK